MKYSLATKTKEQLIGIIRELQEDEMRITEKAISEWRHKYFILLRDWNILNRKKNHFCGNERVWKPLCAECKKARDKK